jgi:hypothetical protein
MEDDSVVDVVGANSAVVYAPDGTFVLNYRKSHLYPMDKPWAKPGQSDSHVRQVVCTSRLSDDYRLTLRPRFRNVPPPATAEYRHSRHLYGP